MRHRFVGAGYVYTNWTPVTGSYRTIERLAFAVSTRYDALRRDPRADSIMASVEQ